MPVYYKFDVLAALKAAGYTTYRLRKDRLLGERVIQQLRDGEPVSWEVAARVCALLHISLDDLVTVEPDPEFMARAGLDPEQ